MRIFGHRLLFVVAGLCGAPALAADALKFGPPPAWVSALAVPKPKAAIDAPIEVLLDDQQYWLEAGRISRYTSVAYRIVKPEGLPAGNLSVSWSPDTDTTTVHKLQIMRGTQVIDVLASGQKFTTLRREANLEQATFDGVLTANIQPEGLQEGDIVVLAQTTVHEDPILKNHVETSFADWNASQATVARARLSWPAGLPIKIKTSGDLPKGVEFRAGTARGIEFSRGNVRPWLTPKSAPVRFRLGRLGEASDFSTWADVADLLRPLYDQTSMIPATGPLRDEVNRIKAASTDPTVRAEQALQLVQQRVRYVALLMGVGGLMPATAEQTWSRRYGDCKAKTALLLGLLRELGVPAEPVVVNAAVGDIIAERLPAVGMFNHVLVRATLAGRPYWLDGTRNGDVHLVDLQTPNFGWGLPLVRNAKLVRIVPEPLVAPLTDQVAEIDASKGLYVAAPARITSTLRGDFAVALNGMLAGASEEQRQELYRAYLQDQFSDVTLQSGRYTFDRDSRQLRMEIAGTLKPDWSDGFLYVPASSIGYTPDLDRPTGALHDVPYAVEYPAFNRTSIRVKLPEGFPAQTDLPRHNVDEQLAGAEFKRSVRFVGGALLVDTSTRTLASEVTAIVARASEARLKAIADGAVALRLPANYGPSEADMEALKAKPAGSAREHQQRGFMYLNFAKYDQAIAEFTAVLAATPDDEWALANRGLSYVWQRNDRAADLDLIAAAKVNSANPVIARARGLQAEFKADWPTALRFYSQALAVDPSSSFALTHRARIYRTLKDPARALADIDALLKLGDTSDRRLLRANFLMAFGRVEDAAAEARIIAAKEPGSVMAQVTAARVLANVGQWGEADQAFARALAIKPEWYIYVNRAEARPRSEQTERLSDLDRALVLGPDEPEALAAKAAALTEVGQFAASLPIYDRALKLAPDNPQLRLRRTIAQYRAGDRAAAERGIAAIRAKATKSGEFNSLCWQQATANILLDSALADCHQALKLEPDNGPVLDSLAFVQLRLGRHRDAVTTYGKAIDRHTGASPYFGRALAYEKLNESARAAADLKEALRLSPTIADEYAAYGLALTVN
ncbi:MAG: DUF3857 domain-containing protein [Pseudomonadota bacterium]